MSSTRIELEEPYKSLWRFGYLVTNKEPRRNVILYNSAKDRSTVSYARYLYEVSMGKLLESEYVVDHIDGNQMNDTLENFQLLTVAENNEKRYNDHKPNRKMVKMICGSCENIFEREIWKTHLYESKNKRTTYCSRKCSGMKKKESEVIEIYMG